MLESVITSWNPALHFAVGGLIGSSKKKFYPYVPGKIKSIYTTCKNLTERYVLQDGVRVESWVNGGYSFCGVSYFLSGGVSILMGEAVEPVIFNAGLAVLGSRTGFLLEEVLQRK